MKITEHDAALDGVRADIAAGMERIVAQVERLHAVIRGGGNDRSERVALWELENNQASLHCLQSAILNRIARAEAAKLVLVVDDESLTLMAAVDCLTSSGFAVVEAGDAAQAIEMLEANPSIRAIFTDVQMRGSMNGIDLAREVHRRWPAVQVVVTSGSQSISADDLPPGDQFVRKPYAAIEVVAALRAS